MLRVHQNAYHSITYPSLFQIAATPGCWVISGGTNAGVMKHVGDALQGSNACVGIATWGILTKKEMLQPDPSEPEGSYVKETCKYEIGEWDKKIRPLYYFVVPIQIKCCNPIG